ncbi:MAG: hypothetical protein RJA55_1595 [Acidobacteriota bacterium]|jgi:hypothetical protein
MGAIVTRYGDPVVKYHAKDVVADEATAIVTTLNPTRKCFSRTWDAVLVTEDVSVVRGLLALFRADTTPVTASAFSTTSCRIPTWSGCCANAAPKASSSR